MIVINGLGAFTKQLTDLFCIRALVFIVAGHWETRYSEKIEVVLYYQIYYNSYRFRDVQYGLLWPDD